MSVWRRLNAWADRHPRLFVTLDALFLVGFWSLALVRNDGWGYFLATAWTVRVVLYDWWWQGRRGRARGKLAPGEETQPPSSPTQPRLARGRRDTRACL